MRGEGRSQARSLTVLILVVLVILSGLGIGGYAVYRTMYSPSAFVSHYLSLLAESRATDALRIPGVALDSEAQESLGLPAIPSDALLRSTALADLTDVEIIEERADAEGIFHVTATYHSGGASGTTEFTVVQDGWIGVVPRWRFAASPLAVIQLVVRGSHSLAINDFSFDRRQIAGIDSDPLEPVPLLVLVPGRYDVSVDSAVSTSSGTRILAERVLAVTDVDIQTEPTAEFTGVVQDRVNEFLEKCATQEVLQPTGCPFGYQVRNQITEPPQWSIPRQPRIELVPDGAHWRIPATSATAHIDVDVRLIFDGQLVTVSEDVDFEITGSVTMLPDGTFSIRVGAPGS